MLKVIDIGHKNYGLDTAIAVLEAEVSKIIYNGESKAMKIIHGHGTGALKGGYFISKIYLKWFCFCVQYFSHLQHLGVDHQVIF